MTELSQSLLLVWHFVRTLLLNLTLVSTRCDSQFIPQNEVLPHREIWVVLLDSLKLRLRPIIPYDQGYYEKPYSPHYADSGGASGTGAVV